jgi:hypothetical protein
VTKPASPSISGVAVLVFDVGRIASGATASTGARLQSTPCQRRLGRFAKLRTSSNTTCCSFAGCRLDAAPSVRSVIQPGELIYERADGRR